MLRMEVVASGLRTAISFSHTITPCPFRSSCFQIAVWRSLHMSKFPAQETRGIQQSSNPTTHYKFSSPYAGAVDSFFPTDQQTKDASA